MINGIDLILGDHRRVEELFAQVGGEAGASVAGRIFEELTMHDEVEQHALYPLARQLLDDDDLLDRAMLDHARVKMLIERARSLEGPPLVEALTELREAVRAHVEDEERRLLPAMAERATPGQLEVLAARIEQIKQRVG